MTVARLLTEMDSEEFLAWRELIEIEAEEARRAQTGERPGRARRPRRVVSDAAEIRAWFTANR